MFVLRRVLLTGFIDSADELADFAENYRDCEGTVEAMLGADDFNLFTAWSLQCLVWRAEWEKVIDGLEEVYENLKAVLDDAEKLAVLEWGYVPDSGFLDAFTLQGRNIQKKTIVRMLGAWLTVIKFGGSPHDPRDGENARLPFSADEHVRRMVETMETNVRVCVTAAVQMVGNGNRAVSEFHGSFVCHVAGAGDVMYFIYTADDYAKLDSAPERGAAAILGLLPLLHDSHQDGALGCLSGAMGPQASAVCKKASACSSAFLIAPS